jgi:hypothetical protein
MPGHIFSEHLLRSGSFQPLPGSGGPPVWPSLYVIVVLAGLAVLRVTSFSRVVRIIQSAFSRQVLQKFSREEPNPFRLHSILLLGIFIANVAFLCYRINLAYGFVLVDSPGKLQFIFFCLILICVVVLKLAANKALALMSGNYQLMDEYTLGSLCILQTDGLALFPLIILMHFAGMATTVFMAASAALIAASVILRWYRGMIAALAEGGVGILQIFSYFCALEILPALVLSKFIIETF